jgi:hypothetical protein
MARKLLFASTEHMLQEQAKELFDLFDSTHLPVDLKPTASEFEFIASAVYNTPGTSFQKVECLRNLLAAKDAAVRMKVLMRDGS